MILKKQLRAADPVPTILPRGMSNWREPMIDERVKRRPGFIPGMPIRLADHQEWWVPAPSDLRGPDAGSDDPEYAYLLEAVDDAEDAAELRRAELALGIFLLSRNYQFSPSEFAELLEVPPGSPRFEVVRAAFRGMADAHVPRRPPVEAVPPAEWSHGWRGVLSRCADRALGRHIDTPA
jgi:hypothetical protein